MSTTTDPTKFPTPPTHQHQYPPLFIIFTVILLIIFFMGFFFMYFCKCFMENLLRGWTLQRTPSGNLVGTSSASAPNGLDPSLLDGFPTFAYSTVKDFRREKYGLECAICLLEFEDDSMLRLLTGCFHVFHQECIDLWLETHKTCPVCRKDLESPPDIAEKSQDQLHPSDHEAVVHDHNHINQNDSSTGNNHHDPHVCIDVKDQSEDHNEHESKAKRQDGQASTTKQPQQKELARKKNGIEGVSFCRSHSTGHSIVVTKEGGGGGGGGGGDNDDKYTLRLPEHVELKVLRGHNWTKSCTSYKEMTKHRAYSFSYVEVSGGGGYSCGDKGEVK